MFFDSIDKIPEIAKNTGFSIFAIDPKTKIDFKNVFYLEPDEKTNKISVEAVRNFVSMTNTKQTKDQFLVVLKPETMNQEGLNAFLKNLEEPKDKYHFVFLTENPTALLPTILSRAQLFFLKTTKNFNDPINASEEIKTFAKRLMTASERELVALSKEIADKKDRNLALEIITTAIEMSYKTFLLTNNSKFLTKLPNLINLYENISMNGHIKLHFVADML